MEEISDFVHPGHKGFVRWFAWGSLAIIAATMVGLLVAFWFEPDRPSGEPGALAEETVAAPAGLRPVAVEDATAVWGLGDWTTTGVEPLRGGVALGDLDVDGDLDLVVGGGDLAIYRWTGAAFGRLDLPGLESELSGVDVISVNLGDVDRDGHLDVLVGHADGALVLWGTGLIDGFDGPYNLPLSGLVTGVIPVELDVEAASGFVELVTLGYQDLEGPSSDRVWSFDSRSEATSIALPDSRRRSMAAQIADVDGDGLVDIWVGRDVRWDTGGDSIYSRVQGEDWVDIAADLAADLEVDAMGLTLADFTADGVLDAYISDLGDNEFLIRSGSSFERREEVGAARIRPQRAADHLISSSWASGAVDLNLDGLLDLVVVNGGFGEITVANKIVNTLIVEDDPPALLLATGAGTFYDAWEDQGLEWVGRSRGLSIGDVDGDGRADLIVVDHEGAVHALRNTTVGTTSRTATLPEPCRGLGAVLHVERVDGYAVLGSPQAFLGAHAPHIVVAAPDGIEPTLRWEVPGRARWLLRNRPVSDGYALLTPPPWPRSALCECDARRKRSPR